MTTDAYNYARTIAEELRGLDMIQDELTNLDPDEFSTETRRYCDDLGISEDHAHHDVGRYWLLNDVLDVWAEVRWRQDRSDVHAVTALRSSGGPHREVTWDGNGNDMLTVHAWWGSDTATVRVECATVAEAMALVWDNADAALGGPTD